MNIIKEIENIGTVRYEESFWTGKKSLFLNGVPLTKLSKTEFEYAKDEVVMKFSLNGSVLSGVNVVVNGARYELLQKTACLSRLLPADDGICTALSRPAQILS